MIRANIYTIPTLEDSYNIDNVITTLTSRCDDKELAREIIVMDTLEKISIMFVKK